jgi:hypothetical protein
MAKAGYMREKTMSRVGLGLVAFPLPIGLASCGQSRSVTRGQPPSFFRMVDALDDGFPTPMHRQSS